MKYTIAIIALLVLVGIYLTPTGHTVIKGHVDDAITRIVPIDYDGSIVSGGIVGTGRIDEEADGQDVVHNARGHISIVSTTDGHYIQLGNDFHSSPGPDYHVYISVGPDIDNEEDFLLFKRYELGELKSGVGPSFYKVSDEILDEIDHLQSFSVVIWCKAFGEYIGAATVEWDSHEQ